MAVSTGRIPLPGGLNDELDADLDEPKRPGDRGEDRGASPKKPRQGHPAEAGTGGVTMDALRSLLAEQSVSLLQAQQLQISTALSAFEERQGGRMDKLEHRVHEQGSAVEGLEARLRDLGDRLAKVESQGAPAVGHGPDRRSTLVFGGWAPETRRMVLLHQLDQALTGLKLKSYLDCDPFTTGARRSVSLCQFRARPNETQGEARQRMLHVVQTVNSAKLELEGGVRPLWCSFSKSPEERGRAALAAVVKKAVLRAAPHRAADLDVEFQSGRSWIKEDQISGMGTAPTEVREPRVVHTKGGEGWIDDRTLARRLREETSLSLHMLICPLRARTIGQGRSHLRRSMNPVARDVEKMISSFFKKSPEREKGGVIKNLRVGQWFRIDIVPSGEGQEEVHAHFAQLPDSANRVIYQGDVNTGFGWVDEHEGMTAVPKEGKGGILHKVITERELAFGVPEPAQINTPTSRPRQEGRQGQCIDVMCYKGIRCRGWGIHEDSYMKVGTDHELCFSQFALQERRQHRRHETRPRTWVGGVAQIDRMDQEYIEQLAAQCTKPQPSQGYKDTPEIKQAFKAAKLSGTAAKWKQALKMRKQARRLWEQERLVRASQGDWQSFKALKPRKQVGWDLGFAEAQQGEPHQVVHDHLAAVYQGEEITGVTSPWEGDVVTFTLEELTVGVSQLKRGKAVGVDKTSTELVQGLMEVPGGRQTSDYLYSIIRLFELSREWGKPLVVFKLDLEKAFDTLDRGSLMQRLEERLGPGAELNCWRELLRGTVGHLQTPWGATRLPMTRGIKQGAVESPTLFAWIAELAMSEAISKYGWHNTDRLFEGLQSEEMLYKDDGMVWGDSPHTVQGRVAQLASELSRYGLRLNPKKCQLYASPKVEGERAILVEGVRVEAADTLEVMGLVLRVGMSIYELASPLASRARAKFWELKHIFRAQGGSMKQRARVMQKVVGGTALWCVCCLPPDAATMTMLNSVQLQLMVWSPVATSRLQPESVEGKGNGVGAADGRDSGKPPQDRRKQDHDEEPDYTIRDLQKSVEGDATGLMQGSSTRQEGWFTKAKKEFSALHGKGESSQTALLLRDHLRNIDDARLHAAVQAHLPDILETADAEDSGGSGEPEVTAVQWVRSVLMELARLAGLSSSDKEILLTPVSGFDLLPQNGADEEDHADETEEDIASLFQQGDRTNTWEDLMEQLGRWFDSGLAVDLALAMLRQYDLFGNYSARFLPVVAEGGLGEDGTDDRTHPAEIGNVNEAGTGKLFDEIGEFELQKKFGMWQWCPRDDEATRATVSTDPAPTAPADTVPVINEAAGIPDLQQPMLPSQAVEMWRYLLFARDAFTVPDSWLPLSMLRDIQVHMEAMSEHNLAMMTTGLVSVIRFLMAELSQTMDFAQAIINTRDHGEAPVDIDDDQEPEPEMEGDGSSMMQAFFESSGKDTMPRRWARAMLRLHKELEAQPKPMRIQSIAALRGCMPALMLQREATTWQAQLQALLVAVQEDSQAAEGEMAVPVGWVQSWVEEISAFIPGFRFRQPPQAVDSLPDQEIDELVREEAEEAAWRGAEHRRDEEEEARREAHEHLCEQEAQHLLEEAAAYKRWERTMEKNSLKRSTPGAEPAEGKRQCCLSVEVASSSSDRPRVLHTLSFDVPTNGSALTFSFRANMQSAPSEVSTEPVVENQGEVPPEDSSAVQSGEHLGPAQPSVLHDSLTANRDSVPELLQLMEFEEYAHLYDKWKRGDLTQQQVVQMYGTEAMELMLAQEAVGAAVDDEGHGGSGEVALTEQDRNISATEDHKGMYQNADGVWQRIPFSRFEAIYGQWRAGHRTDDQIGACYGEVWLALFRQWKVWGLDGIWPYLYRVLDALEDCAVPSAVGREFMLPDALPLPLRVPWSTVKVFYQCWKQGSLTDRDVVERFGEIWLVLFQKIAKLGVSGAKRDLDVYVDWDIPDVQQSIGPATRDEPDKSDGRP
ncbi:NLRC3 [Symbiodinium microadriaticum]|nr:NLRC3 [Symbiodinium microadriaticum]